MVEVVVFDLDRTLLSDDSTKIWLVKQLKSNIFRYVGAIIVMPIAIPLMKFKKFKSLGISLFLWIATYGLNRTQLEQNFDRFAQDIINNGIPNLYWFEEGLAVLKKHIQEGREIIIATASSKLLAKALFKSIGLELKIIGTPLQHKMNGWVGGVHCRHAEKLKRLQLMGVNPQWFATYSDDIKEDYPILSASLNAYLINVNQPIPNKRLENIHYLKWDK